MWSLSDELTTFRDSSFSRKAPDDVSLIETLKELEKQYTSNSNVDTFQDEKIDFGKELLLGERSTIDDLQTNSQDPRQEETYLNSPQLPSFTRSLNKGLPATGGDSPQLSSYRSETAAKLRMAFKDDGFMMNAEEFKANSPSSRTEDSNSTSQHEGIDEATVSPFSPGVCSHCNSGKRLVFRLGQTAEVASCHPCLENRPFETEKLLRKPLVGWPSYVQNRGYSLFLKSGNEEKAGDQGNTVLNHEQEEHIRQYLAQKSQQESDKYHAALSEITLKTHKKLPLLEKITCLKVVHDLLHELLTTRSLLEDLELGRYSPGLEKLLPGHTSMALESRHSSLSSSDDEIHLGKRKSAQALPVELSSSFSWSEESTSKC